jgi:hypothetical protein
MHLSQMKTFPVSLDTILATSCMGLWQKEQPIASSRETTLRLVFAEFMQAPFVFQRTLGITYSKPVTAVAMAGFSPFFVWFYFMVELLSTVTLFFHSGTQWRSAEQRVYDPVPPNCPS